LHAFSEQFGDASRDVACVDELISMGLKPWFAAERRLARPAELALALNPCVVKALETDVPGLVVERLGD